MVRVSDCLIGISLAIFASFAVKSFSGGEQNSMTPISAHSVINFDVALNSTSPDEFHADLLAIAKYRHLPLQVS